MWNGNLSWTPFSICPSILEGPIHVSICKPYSFGGICYKVPEERFYSRMTFLSPIPLAIFYDIQGVYETNSLMCSHLQVRNILQLLNCMKRKILTWGLHELWQGWTWWVRYFPPWHQEHGDCPAEGTCSCPLFGSATLQLFFHSPVERLFLL